MARNVLREKLFDTHPYALRTSGRAEAVQKLAPAHLADFKDNYVVAQNGVLAVFGDVKAEEVLRLVEKNFGAMPAGQLALSNPPKPVAPGAPLSVVEERNKQQAVVMIGYPGADVLSPDRTLLDLLNEASNDLGSRFSIESASRWVLPICGAGTSPVWRRFVRLLFGHRSQESGSSDRRTRAGDRSFVKGWA